MRDLAALLDQATPAIRAAIRRKLPEAEAEDLVSETRLRLLDRLQRADSEPLDDLLGYAAVTAYRVCYSWLRETKPNRTRLSNQVRYIVENDRRLFGRLSAEGRPLDPAALDRLRPFATRALPDLLRLVVKQSSGPLSLDSLIDAVAELQGVRDTPPAALDERSAIVEVDLAAAVDRRRRLAALWEQVRDLPLPQRHALLLNLRDDQGQSAIESLPVCGIASLRDIAATLEIPLAELAELWNRLPLDDQTLAGRLGVTRQQVINLRKSGRERLLRRLGPAVILLAVLDLLSMMRSVQ
jgi:RNA polymerase sigma factor (sigma-70 family)